MCINAGMYELRGRVQEREHSHVPWGRSKVVSSSLTYSSSRFPKIVLVLATAQIITARDIGNQLRETATSKLEKKKILFNTTLYVQDI